MSDIDGTILNTLKSPGPSPQGLTWDGENLWCADRDDRKIYKVDPANGRVLFSISFDGELSGTAWDGQRVWQADRTSRTVSRIDPETGNIDLSIPIDLQNGDVSGLFYEGGGIWYGLSRLGQARKVKDTDGSFMRAFPTRPDICGLVLVGKHLFYTEPGEGIVHKMDANAGSILISYKVGGKPTGLCWDGQAFWIGDAEAKELHRVKF
jgi:glutamine cyclotransferase